MNVLWVGLGGFAGASARYLMGTAIAQRYAVVFPVGTLLINVSGSLLIGFLLTWILGTEGVSPLWRLLLVVGFLGGFTTFSSYSFEVMTLVQDGEWTRAAAYVIGSNVLGISACFVGMMIAKATIA